MTRPALSLRQTLLAVTAGVILIGTAVLAASPVPTLAAADKRALAEIALRWAVDDGLADFKLVKDPKTIVVSQANLPDKTDLKVAEHAVTILSSRQIQVLADKDGDFLYFRFGRFSGDKDHASVQIALVWSIAKQSEQVYLSGGGATLKFEKRDGKWELLPVNNRWMS